MACVSASWHWEGARISSQCPLVPRLHVHTVLDTHVYLEAIVALHCKLCHVRTGAEVDFSIEVISLQVQPPTRMSVQAQL